MSFKSSCFKRTVGQLRAQLLILFLGLLPAAVFGQKRTIDDNGNWSDTGIWSAGNIANTVTEHVDIDNGVGTVRVNNNYYRLRAVDLDANDEIFEVIAISFEGEKKIFAYPNPVAGSELHVKTNFHPQDGDEVLIINRVGKVVKKSIYLVLTPLFPFTIFNPDYVS